MPVHNSRPITPLANNHERFETGMEEINHPLTEEELSAYFSSRDEGNYYDIVVFLNKMRGAPRVSVGLATSKRDIDAFVSFVKEYLGRSNSEPATFERSSLMEFVTFLIFG